MTDSNDTSEMHAKLLTPPTRWGQIKLVALLLLGFVGPAIIVWVATQV